MCKLVYPFTPIAYENESAGSFITRLIQLNAYQHPAAIYKSLANIKTVEAFRSNISHHDKFEHFLSKMKLNKNNYKLALIRASKTINSDVFWGNTLLPSSFFQSDLQHYCPLCLEEKEFWRKDWQLKLYYACPIHHVKLLSSCPKCLKKLNIVRSKLSICSHCQTDIRDAEAQNCSSIHVINWIHNIFYNSDQNFIEYFKNFWRKITKFNVKNQLGMSIEQLGLLTYEYFCDTVSFQKSLDTILSNRLSHLHPRISLLPFLTKDLFTNRYKDFIQKSCGKYIFSDKKNTQDLLSIEDCIKVLRIKREQLKYLIRHFLIETDQSKDKVYISSIISYLSKENEYKELLKEELIKDIKITNNPEYYTLGKAANLLKVNSETVRYLLKDNILPSIKNSLNKTNTLFIEKDLLYKFHNEKILVGALAKELCVNPTNLTEKLASLGIYPINGPKVDQTKNNIFLRLSVKDLTQQCIKSIKTYETSTGRKIFKKQPSTNNIDDSYISLKEASITVGKSRRQVTQLASNNILSKKDSDKGHILIEKKSLKNLLNKIHNPLFVHLNEVLRLLHCPKNWFDEYWVKTGILEVENLLYWKVVPYDQVVKALAIKKEYLTATEASRLMGMHKSHISNLQTQGLIKPLLFGEQHQIKLYKKTHVLKLIKEGYGSKLPPYK